MTNHNVLLAASIALGLSSGALAQSIPPEGYELPPVVVVGSPQDPIPVPAGNAPGRDDNYWWKPTNQPNSGGNAGEVTPDLPEPSHSSPYCALMVMQGFPEGCSRQYLQEGPPQIAGITDPWELDHLAGYAFNSHLLNMYFDYSLIALRSCYSDITNDPLHCESSYSSTIRSICNIHAQPFQSARNDMTDRELCNQGADQIDHRMAVIASNRIPGFWFRYFEDIQIGIIRNFYVAVDLITPHLPMDQYNELLTEARRFMNCKIVIETWDEQGCGPLIPS
jgi:hypothetical protein